MSLVHKNVRGDRLYAADVLNSEQYDRKKEMKKDEDVERRKLRSGI